MLDEGGPASVRAGLKQVVADYASRGTDLSADPRLAEAVLLDSFPESPAAVRALVEAVRSGVIQHMRDRASQGAEFAIQGSASQLAEIAGLREDLARWSAESWWNALSLGGEKGGDAGGSHFGGAAVATVLPSAPASPPPMTVTSVPGEQAAPAPWGGAPPTAEPDRAAGPAWTAAPTAPPQQQPAGQPWTAAPAAPPQQPANPSWTPQQQAPSWAAAPGTDEAPWASAPTSYGDPTSPPQYVPQQAPSPQQGQYAPQQGQYAPQQGQYAPQQGQYAPQQGQYAPQAPSGPAAPQNRNKLIAVTISIVVVVYLIAAAAGHLPPFSKAKAVVTPTTTTAHVPGSSTSPTTVTTLPSGADQTLLAAIPNSADASCVALTATEIAKFAPGAAAVEGCQPVTGEPEVAYALYSTADGAEGAYDRIIDTGGLPKGSCNDANNVQDPYFPGSNTTNAIGSLACYVLDGNDQYLFWWHYSDNIVATTNSTTLSLSQLSQDWRGFGPS